MNQKTSEKSSQKAIPKTPMAFCWYVMKPFKGLVFLSFGLVFLANILVVALPYVLKNIVDAALAMEAGEGAASAVQFWIFAIPVVLGSMYACWRLSGFVGMNWLIKAEALAHNKLYQYVTRHSHSYFSDRFAGSVSNKISHAAEGIHKIMSQILWSHFASLISFLATGLLIFYTNVLVGLTFFGLVFALVPMNIWLAKKRRPHAVKYSESKTKLRGQTVDTVSNVSAMRQYARRPFELSNLSRGVDHMSQTNLKQWGMSEWILVLNNVVIVLAIGLMMYFMSVGWQAGTISTGDFILIVTLVFSFNSTLVFIGNSIVQFTRVYSEMEEGLGETLVGHDIVDQPNAEALKVSESCIDWQNVEFDFDGKHVFTDFSLTIPAGQRMGLVGQSGAGKTTFVSLLLRQHDLTSGVICIDGQSIAEVTQESLRNAIAVVPQEPALFHRTIRENIFYGNPEATEAELIEVSKKAQAYKFITELPKGFDTLVGERGIKLSGGQKQRVAIARAMLKDAPILVLDEATSALDSESEVEIQKALEALMEGRTVIAIAHRLSTLRKMDRIIVMEEGSIIEDGDHESLATSGGIYERLWNHQAGGFLQD